VAITKTTTTSIKDASVEEANINNCAATNTKLGADAVTSAKINNGTVTADDLASTLDLSSKTVTLPSDAISFDREYNNIGLLGFKMAVNESLTVFNLVDGVVDEFNDESGTDEAEGSNDFYCATSDFYDNVNSICVSAGFTVNSITEPDTSTVGTNPAQGVGTAGIFTVPTGLTSLNLALWGGGGGGTPCGVPSNSNGGGGGYASGTLAVTGGQSFMIVAGEAGSSGPGIKYGGYLGNNPGEYIYCAPSPGAVSGTLANSTGASGGSTNINNSQAGGAGAGGGMAALLNNPVTFGAGTIGAPDVIAVAGGGGGGSDTGCGGAGGGLIGDAADIATEQTNRNSGSPSNTGCQYGGGGDQEQGGQSGSFNVVGDNGGFLYGGNSVGCISNPSPMNYWGGGGGGGYYGGGSGVTVPTAGTGGGGGGSSYYGHPQITCGATEEGANKAGGGTAIPTYVPGTNEGGEDGYVLLTGTACVAASTTIVSSTFTSTTVPTTSRIVVFEENIDTPTLNTDIIASVSRDGTNFTNATLSDSGYVTGSSGQRILTGQADISGQPSGQSMRWKLQLANNQVKIHGVSLSWA
jgi:hypothetical protein